MGGVSMEWKEDVLGNVLEVKYGKDHKKLADGQYPVYGSGGLMRYVDSKLYDGPSILIPRKGTLNNIMFVDNPFWTVDTMFWSIINTDKVDPKFLFYSICKRDFASMNVGSAVPSMTVNILNDIQISYPKNIDDQRRIASILSSLDRKIELNNKINADLEEMAQAIFKNWFVDFEPFKDGKFVDSELGMIPEGWKVGRLTDVIKLMPGGTPKTTEPLYWDNGTIPFFSPKDVNGVYCFATEKHITETGLNKCSSNLYPKDTIFITCRGTVGKVCLAACDMAMNQSNYAIKAIDGYSQYYFFFLVKSVVERLIKKSNGAVFSAITSKDFDEEILIPSQKAVEDFTNVIDGFFRRIFTIGTENSRLSLLRDTLLPRLMSGELEVPE